MADRPDQSLAETFREAVAAGDFVAARAMIARLRDARVETRPFELELSAARWLAGRPGAALPSPDEVRGLVAAGPAAVLGRIAASCTRAALLGLDAVAAARWQEVHRMLEGAAGAPEAIVHAALSRARVSLLEGEHAEARAAIASASGLARAEKLGGAVAEAQVIAALVALGEDDAAEATAAARRAVRMARSEGIVAVELLANLALARVRRANGAPYLAARILSALREIATEPFWPWLDYELALAGGGVSDPRARTPAGALARLLDALSASDETAVAGEAAALRGTTRGFADLDAEARDLVAALGASDGPCSPAMGEFVAGRSPAVPRGLFALSAIPHDEAPPVVGYVVAWPGGRARRVLAPGAGFVGRGTDAVRLDPSRRPQERTDAALAFLASSPAALDEDAFFHELYGFAYRPELHASVLSTLLHRVRTTLGTAATLHRDHGSLRLEVHRTLVAWDPRCQRPLEDRILAVLTAGGPTTAKGAADRLGIPLRTVQAALGQLVDAGACKRDRQGRSIEYVVEDTTFSEPTVTRARAWREGE